MSKTGVKSDGSSTAYYKIPEAATDLIDLIEYKRMDFGIGNIFKACYRFGEKDGIDQEYDLRKIIFFAQRKLDELAKRKREAQKVEPWDLGVRFQREMDLKLLNELTKAAAVAKWPPCPQCHKHHALGSCPKY